MTKYRRTGDWPRKAKPAPAKSYFIFVYGTLKQGEGNHRLLEQAEYVYNATTFDRFRMFHVGFPVLMDDVQDGRPVGKVQGEVYKVNEEQLRRLDQLEAEGSMYKRREIEVFTDEGFQMTVLAYVGMPKYWRGLGQPTTSRYGQPVLPVHGIINWKGRRDEE